MRRRPLAMPTRRTSSPGSRAGSISSYGSSNRTGSRRRTVEFRGAHRGGLLGDIPPMRQKVTGPTRVLAAEFIGTFSLIFIGAGAATALGANHDPAVAFAHGLTIMVFITAFGDISGCHINPAVTIGLAAAGEFPARRVVPYIAAQLAGAIAARYCLLLVFHGPVANLGATVIDTSRITYVGAFAFEALGTFLLVNTVLHTAVRRS